MVHAPDPEPRLDHDHLDGWSLDGEPITEEEARQVAEQARIRRRIEHLPAVTVHLEGQLLPPPLLPSYEELVSSIREQEAIVRALAAAHPVGEDNSGTAVCMLCAGQSVTYDPPAHDADCPWRLAVEWVANHR